MGPLSTVAGAPQKNHVNIEAAGASQGRYGLGSGGLRKDFLEGPLWCRHCLAESWLCHLGTQFSVPAKWGDSNGITPQGHCDGLGRQTFLS